MAGAGCIDLVDVDGEAYQVQTELTDPERGRVRTVIFRHGSVVAVNESTLRSVVELAGDEESIREVVDLHHSHLLHSFVSRTSSFVERLRTGQRPAPTAVRPAPAVSAPAADTADEIEMPPYPEDPALADGLDVRRLFAMVWRRIGGPGSLARPGDARASAQPQTDAMEAGLVRAADALAWALEQPALQRARVDEQAHFHLLRDRVVAWAEQGRDPSAVEWIWNEVVVFCQYVREINHRAELLSYDRSLAQWARRALRRHGPTRATLKPVSWLLGRDPELDELLESGADVPLQVWLAHVDRIWDRLTAS